ncbi:MAG: flagellar protein FlaG [Alicyclobacillus herbarius]|uniref:flagellar protein FlaG n=1 Tax=Alicyclobacillus herbarius TaxID=122960 RepID=UPI002355FF51|nr:flagellar protein FlaG [Alicyclobacillus herbarius]MCL6633711.1 flagellar protein FlaG [Alicyclobacillus herbarius]
MDIRHPNTSWLSTHAQHLTPSDWRSQTGDASDTSHATHADAVASTTVPFITPVQVQQPAVTDSAQAEVNRTTLQKAIDAVNQHLAPRQMRVEFQYDDKANRLFVNVIDVRTGQLVQEIPPEGVRRLLEGRTEGILSDGTI